MKYLNINNFKTTETSFDIILAKELVLTKVVLNTVSKNRLLNVINLARQLIISKINIYKTPFVVYICVALNEVVDKYTTNITKNELSFLEHLIYNQVVFLNKKYEVHSVGFSIVAIDRELPRLLYNKQYIKAINIVITTLLNNEDNNYKVKNIKIAKYIENFKYKLLINFLNNDSITFDYSLGVFPDHIISNTDIPVLTGDYEHMVNNIVYNYADIIDKYKDGKLSDRSIAYEFSIIFKIAYRLYVIEIMKELLNNETVEIYTTA